MVEENNENWQEIDQAYIRAISMLGDLIAIPSVAAQNRGSREAAEYCKRIIEDLGGEASIFDDLPGNPVVYGFFQAGSAGNSDNTLLFYNHYDVQPEEPLNEWDSPPFALTEKEGKLFARGVGDNKGDIAARLAAIHLLQQQPGGLPCNIKFLIEGEEEIGSPNLAAFVEKYKEAFSADACIWEFGYKDESERLGLVAGLKGLLYFELICKGAEQDLHSLSSGYIDNPVLRLTHALSSIKSIEGEILIEGFHDDAEKPTEQEVWAVKQLPFDEKAIKELYNLKLPLLTERSGKDPREVSAFESLLTVCGIYGGYTGEGAKTLIPGQATAKVEVRLVAGQEPQRVIELLRNHLDQKGFPDIEINVINDRQRGFRSSLSNDFVQLVRSTAEELYPDGVTLTPNHPGCGPMHVLGSILKLPIVSTGIGWSGSKYHAPNENVRIRDFKQGIAHIALLLRRFGEQEFNQ
ncbi:acetylornithine deacetylase [Paenibacillus antibioticophila]|uniref:Acetylornithine deacetylase n=1 Tax=Paenibacillus antibioticophila TaxID=1274374 RepID=A0A919XUG5_9BACL|nr:M20/M25/M40 family metallo-hydrolase [Paenibacillus antibioticophila]GIO38656.1 acetylornithine deacetylase [Paenibacillus antibioticophila]